MQGPKTHEQQLRILEKKPDVPDQRQTEARVGHQDESHPPRNAGVRQSEFPVSRQGMNQESDHNKHNDGERSAHKPQKPTDLVEKQTK
jgi:hypothetical protein